jgi:hypothetical protein
MAGIPHLEHVNTEKKISSSVEVIFINEVPGQSSHKLSGYQNISIF